MDAAPRRRFALHLPARRASHRWAVAAQSPAGDPAQHLGGGGSGGEQRRPRAHPLPRRRPRPYRRGVRHRGAPAGAFLRAPAPVQGDRLSCRRRGLHRRRHGARHRALDDRQTLRRYRRRATAPGHGAWRRGQGQRRRRGASVTRPRSAGGGRCRRGALAARIAQQSVYGGRRGGDPLRGHANHRHLSLGSRGRRRHRRAATQCRGDRLGNRGDRRRALRLRHGRGGPVRGPLLTRYGRRRGDGVG